MVIRHNISASNANRMIGINNNNTLKSSEKLSSGYRINRGADDAAGLAISEKMRMQIRGLDQGTVNSQDGVSFLQTADKGMEEIHGILQRCKELAVKSATGTYNDEDRELIQDEVTQLTKEVDRLANDTEFNGYAMLSGNCDKNGNRGSSDSLVNSVQYITTSGGVTDKYTNGGVTYASASIDFSNINSHNDVANLIGKGVNYTCCTCTKAYSIKFVNGNPDTTRLNASNPVMEVDVSSITDGTALVNKIIDTAYHGGTGGTNTSFVNHFSQLASDGAKLYIYDDRPDKAQVGNQWPTSNGYGVFNLNVYGEVQSGKEKFFYTDIQVGSEAGQSVRIEVQNVTAKQLGIDNLLVDTKDNASSAITKIDNAISIVSSSRATVGAYQNRLEHTINSTDNTSENLQNAESRIRDTDMAKEVMERTKNNILQQASQNMLAQANKMPESILNLMKQWGQV